MSGDTTVTKNEQTKGLLTGKAVYMLNMLFYNEFKMTCSAISFSKLSKCMIPLVFRNNFNK